MTPVESLPDLLTIAQAASLLQVHQDTLRRWDRDGKLKALRIGSNGQRRYPKSDILALQGSGGNRRGLAGLNARQLLTRMSQVLQAISSRLDAREIAQTVVNEAVEVMGSSRSAVYLMNQAQTLLEPYVAIDPEDPGSVEALFYPNPLPVTVQPLFEEMVDKAIFVCAEDTFNDPRTTQEFFDKFNTRSLIMAPLTTRQNELKGFLGFFWVGQPHRFSEEELIFAKALAAQAAIALENAWLYEASQRDLAKRAQIEKELRESEGRFRQLTENIQEVFWITSADGGEVLYASPAYEKIWGRSAESVYRDPAAWLEAIHPQDRDRVQTAYNSATLSEVGYDQSYRIVRPDGQLRWIHDRGFPVRNAENGEVERVVGIAQDITERRISEARLKEESETLETVNRVGMLLSAELDLQKLVQAVTDAATELTGAEFGAFFYNLIDEKGESYALYTLSGVSRESFAGFPMPRNTGLFGPTFRGEGVIRIDDVHLDPRYGKNDPYYGMPKGHLPVVSYLAAPVISRSGEVLGGLFFGHSKPGVFTERVEHLIAALASQTAIAMDNAHLYARAGENLHKLEEAINFHQVLEKRLSLLIEASSRLLGSLQLNEVLPAILDLSRGLITADAYALWRYQPATRDWRTLYASGLSKAYQAQSATNYGNHLPFEDTILAEDVEAIPMLAHRVEEYRKENIRSMMVIPLWIGGSISGSIAFYYRQPQRFEELEVRVATALANLAATAIGSAELYEDQSQLRQIAERGSHRLAFMAEVSRVLGGSLDYEQTLQNLADLAVPELADWCTVEFPDEDGTTREVALAPRDLGNSAAALELRQRFPSSERRSGTLQRVLESGQPVLVSQLTEEMITAGARDADHLRLIQDLQIKSVMFVPLVARGKTLGILTLASTREGRYYGKEDLRLAGEVAQRAATAVDNALLYREAQQAILVRDEFLSVAAHELKTPLTNLLGFSQLLQRSLNKDAVDPGRLRHGLQTIDQQSRKLSRLVSQLLDITRLDSAKLALEPGLIDLPKLVEEVVSVTQGNTEKHRITVQGPASFEVQLDPLRIEQVLVNLLDNAVKYSPDGGPVEVEIAPDPAAHTVRIAVTDHGFGIPPERRDRLFDRFYQAHAQSYLGGLGLGLYISRQIVELHGGSLRAEFPAGSGTRFVITLPVKN